MYIKKYGWHCFSRTCMHRPSGSIMHEHDLLQIYIHMTLPLTTFAKQTQYPCMQTRKSNVSMLKLVTSSNCKSQGQRGIPNVDLVTLDIRHYVDIRHQRMRIKLQKILNFLAFSRNLQSFTSTRQFVLVREASPTLSINRYLSLNLRVFQLYKNSMYYLLRQ